MEWLVDDRRDSMGNFHNALVDLVDTCELTPPEVIVLLRMVANNIERLFEAAMKAPKPNKEESDGGDIQETSV